MYKIIILSLFALRIFKTKKITSVSLKIEPHSIKDHFTTISRPLLADYMNIFHNKLERVFGLQVRYRELDIVKIRKFLTHCLEIFGFFWELFGKFFRLFLDYFLRNFLAGFFEGIFCLYC